MYYYIQHIRAFVPIVPKHLEFTGRTGAFIFLSEISGYQ